MWSKISHHGCQLTAQLGFTVPTLARNVAALYIRGKNDVILQSHTGSGKTLAYSLPVLSSVDVSRSSIQAVIVVLTRELGQYMAVLKQLSQAVRKKTATVVEGSKNRRQQLWAVAEPSYCGRKSTPAFKACGHSMFTSKLIEFRGIR